MTGTWYKGAVTFKENKDQSDAAFFKGVYMRFHQKKAIDFICETDRTFKGKKIFFDNCSKLLFSERFVGTQT